MNISIHAPREGSDQRTVGRSLWSTHFNPRSPRGERLLPSNTGGFSRDFNPRSPRGERPTDGWALLVEHPFQSTLPARGATFAI